MDIERVQRLGSLVAIGVASQVAAEFITSKSSTHSFWILVGVSLVMVVIQVVFRQLQQLAQYIKNKGKDNKVTLFELTPLYSLKFRIRKNKRKFSKVPFGLTKTHI